MSRSARRGSLRAYIGRQDDCCGMAGGPVRRCSGRRWRPAASPGRQSRRNHPPRSVAPAPRCPASAFIGRLRTVVLKRRGHRQSVPCHGLPKINAWPDPKDVIVRAIDRTLNSLMTGAVQRTPGLAWMIRCGNASQTSCAAAGSCAAGADALRPDPGRTGGSD